MSNAMYASESYGMSSKTDGPAQRGSTLPSLGRLRGISDVRGALSGLAFLAVQALICAGALLFAGVLSGVGILLFAFQAAARRLPVGSTTLAQPTTAAQTLVVGGNRG